MRKSSGTIYVQLDDARRNSAAFNQNIRHGNWQFETTRPRATGIDEQDAVAPFDQGFMRMAGYHDPNPRRGRINIELREVMDRVNVGSTKLKELRLRNRFRPSPLVIVPTNGGNWRYG